MKLVFKEKINFNKRFANLDILSLIKDCCTIRAKPDETVIPSTIYFILTFLKCDITEENCIEEERLYIERPFYSNEDNEYYDFYHNLRHLAKEIDLCVSFIKNGIDSEKVKEIFHHHKECFHTSTGHEPRITDFSIRFKDDTWTHLEVVAVHSKIQAEYTRFQKELLNSHSLNLSESEKSTLFDRSIIADQDIHFAPRQKNIKTSDNYIMELKFIEYYRKQKNVKIENTDKIKNYLNEREGDCILALQKIASEKYSENMRDRSMESILNDYLAVVVKAPISMFTVGDGGKESLLRNIEEQIKNKNKKQYTIKEGYKQSKLGNVLLIGLRRANFECKDKLKNYIECHLKIKSKFFTTAHVYHDTEKLFSISLT